MRSTVFLCGLLGWLFPLSSGAGTAAQTEHQLHPGPAGYHAMCARTPRLCMHDRRAAHAAGISPPARMDATDLAGLQSLNAELNARIRPVADIEAHGIADHWSLPVRSGDCEDYVIAKKQALLAMGWSADQVLYAVVRRGSGHHAVLVLRTARGDLVLDNLHDRVLPWQASGYQFVVRQSAAAPDRWVQLTAQPSSGGLMTW